jgi:hypothetical protein
MKKLSTLFFALINTLFLQAQYESVVFDYQMAYFNNGQALPAEAMLIFSSDIPKEVVAVELSILKPNGKKPLYTSLWQRSQGQVGESFQLPVNYRLQGNTEYDFHLRYYRQLSEEEKKSLTQEVMQPIDFYLRQQVAIRNGKVELAKSAQKLQGDLDQVLQQELAAYRTADHETEVLFSPMVGQYIQSLAQDSIADGRDQLYQLLKQEVSKMLKKEWWVSTGFREVQDYPTEKIESSLALNIGYGGVLLSGEPDNFTYGNAPYVGLSIPLSNRAYSTALLRNTSISVGAFTQNFESIEGNTITGPVFGRPYFIGLGYSVFRFIRFNAGVVALEEKAGDGTTGTPSFELDRIQVQPFIGLSAEIKFSVGLNNR